MTGFVKIAIDDYYSDSNWTTIVKKYWMLAERVSDPRVQGWFLFDTPLPTVAMVVIYLTFVMVVGPLWMANKKPFRIQNILVGYNAAQVLLSCYMFYEHLASGWWGDYSLTCQPVDYSDSDKARRMLHLCWVYYFSKLSEFADTVFFVLRKKKSQITWLHLYHHTLTPFEAWLLVKFIAGGHGTFSNVVNNLVHIILYSYYMLSAMGPQYNKYLWWKKQLTTLQLSDASNVVLYTILSIATLLWIQFFMVLFHSISALIYDCGYPKLIAAGLILHSLIFIVLFTNFYLHAYKKDKIIPAVNNNNKGEGTTCVQTKVFEHSLGNGHVKANGHSCSNGVANGRANGHIGGGNAIANGSTKASLHEPLVDEHFVRKETNGHIGNGYINGISGLDFNSAVKEKVQ